MDNRWINIIQFTMDGNKLLKNSRVDSEVNGLPFLIALLSLVHYGFQLTRLFCHLAVTTSTLCFVMNFFQTN